MNVPRPEVSRPAEQMDPEAQSQGAALSNCPDRSSGKEGHFGQKDTLEASGLFLEGPLGGGGPWDPG